MKIVARRELWYWLEPPSSLFPDSPMELREVKGMVEIKCINYAR